LERLRRFFLVRLSQIDQCLESWPVIHSQVCQNFAIQFNLGYVQAMNEGVISHPVLFAGRPNPGNPQSSEIPLFVFPMHGRKSHAPNNGFLGPTEKLGSSPPGSFGCLDYFFVPFVFGNGMFHPWHCGAPFLTEFIYPYGSDFLTRLKSASVSRAGLRSFRFRFRLLPLKRWLVEACFRLALPLAVSRIRFLTDFLVFNFGIDLSLYV
jgi:hypothetical protein